MNEKDGKRLKKVIAKINKVPIILPPENPQAPTSTVLDIITDFFTDSNIDFKKDDNGIHFKFDKNKNK